MTQGYRWVLGGSKLWDMGHSELLRSPFLTGRWVGKASDHFDGKRFVNQARTDHASSGSLLKWMANRERGPWRDVEAEPGPPPPTRVERGIRITFVGHATCLVQMDGLNVLTDPVWAKRVSPVQWVGPRRFRPPGIRFEDLPPIDVVLLSHDHYDHLCETTMRKLAQQHDPKVICGLGNQALLEHFGVREVTELDWWDGTSLGRELSAEFVPAQHFSGRGVNDRDMTLWGGFVVRGPSGVVYFAGDTGMGSHFEEVHDRHGPPDVALLPIGAYRPEWFMSRVHISPSEAVEAAQILRAKASVPIHFGTFALADDGQHEPMRALEARLGELGDHAPEFWMLDEGEGRHLEVADSEPLSKAR